MNSFQTIKDDFDEVYSGVQTWIQYYDNRKEVKASLNSCLKRGDGYEYYNKVVETKFLKINLPKPVFHNSQYLIMCASYERFLVSMLKQTLKRINKLSKYSNLKPALKNMNKSYSGSLIAALTSEKPTHLEMNSDTIIENLFLCQSNENEYKLNTEIVHFVNAILKFDNFIKFLSKCNIELQTIDFTEDIGFKKEYSGTKVERKKITEDIHKEISRIRNNIAHNGGSTSVNQAELDNLMKFLPAFTQAIINKVNEAIQSNYS